MPAVPPVDRISIAVYCAHKQVITNQCCVNDVSGCHPASHKICKNNAITVTVHKGPPNPLLFFTFLKQSQLFPGRGSYHYLKSGTLQCSGGQMFSFHSASVVRNVRRHDNVIGWGGTTEELFKYVCAKDDFAYLVLVQFLVPG